MKWCVEFPEETILVVRPSLDAICLDIKPAAKLLSELLYRCSIRKEHQQDAQNMNEVASEQGQESTQDTTLRIYRTQAQLVENMIHEMTEKTLHKVAVPALLLLGYIDLEEYLSMNCYIVHIDRVREALLAYRQGDKQLEQCIRSHLQLEKFPIDDQLEKFPIDRKKFLLQLEKVLIAIRKSSYLKRGRKPRSEAGGEAQSEEPQIIIKIDSKIVIEEEGTYGANAPTPAGLSSEELHEKVDGAIIGVETVKRITGKHKAISSDSQGAIGNDAEEEDTAKMPAIKIGASTHATTDHSPRPGLSSGRARGSAADDRDSVVGRLDEMPGQAVKLQAVAAGQAPIVTSLPIDNDPSQQSTVSHTPGTPAPLPLAVGVADATSRHGDAGSVQATSRSLLLSETAQADFPPAAGSAASGATTAQASGDHVTPASNIPKRPKLKSDPREVQGRIDAYRGYALEEKVEIIRERQAVKTWCNLHDLSDFDLVLHYLTTQDKYWKLEENKHRIGGVTLAKETPKALAALERKGKPPGEVTYADNDYSPKAQLWRQEHMARSGK